MIIVLGASGRIGSRIFAKLRDRIKCRLHDVRGYDTVARGDVLQCSIPDDLDAVLIDALHLQPERDTAKRDLVVCALPYEYCVSVAQAAIRHGASYIDLTEDVATATRVAMLAADAIDAGVTLVPQCGLAPGIVSSAASRLVAIAHARQERVSAVRIRVGALPRIATGVLRYATTWSVCGLVNEYMNPCEIVRDNAVLSAMPLDGLERLVIDGAEYEAFHTSGGIGSLARSLATEGIPSVDYKTIRYPGHRDAMRFLFDELSMTRDELERMLSRVPTTDDDVVHALVEVDHESALNAFITSRWYRRIEAISGETAIQRATADVACAIAELIATETLPRGLVKMEDVPLASIMVTGWGRTYE